MSSDNADPPAVHLHEEAPPAVRDIRETLVLKEGDLFLLSDIEGNIARGNVDGLGLYHQDTRFLSTFELVIQGLRPTVLLSTAQAPFLASQVLTNPNLVLADGQLVHEQTVQIRRLRRLRPRAVRESITLESFTGVAIRLEVAFLIAADFVDMFEIRGLVRDVRRPAPDLAVLDDRSVRLSRVGLDGVRRSTTLTFETPPTSLAADAARFQIDLPPRGSVRIDIAIDVDPGFAERARHPVRVEEQNDRVVIESTNGAFDAVFRQARRDLRMLMSGDDDAPYLAAGTPWYACLFGRDSLLAALMDLWLVPARARGTLRLLASLQGTKDDAWRDEEPGKIPHEVRRGDLVGQGLVPFDPYYGTVDATPLWIILLGAYHRTTADLKLVQELLPNLEAALQWIDVHGDLDGDGFVEYLRRSPSGILNQGWKDSWDGIVHVDGSCAVGAIALVEVQAYVYAAKRAAASLFHTLGDHDRAAKLRQQAQTLRERFDEAFWMPTEGTYCLALDGDKRQVASIASNAGHALWCGIIPADKAELVSRRLMREDMHSGWGIRTLSARERGYNPAGYHRGTVWPHDNALAALGFAHYGHTQLLSALVTGLFDAAQHFPSRRTPELFCGYARGAFGEPVRYPVACSPQAWAATAWSACLQAMLGLQIDAPSHELRIRRPSLPRWLQGVRIQRIPVGDGEVDLRYDRVGDHTAVDVAAMRGDVRVTFVEPGATTGS